MSSAPQLFCSPKLVDQSAEGGKKKRNKNQTTHQVNLTTPLNLILCKPTAQPRICSQIRIWVWCFYLFYLFVFISCAWLELWEPTEAQTKKPSSFTAPLEEDSGICEIQGVQSSKSHSGTGNQLNMTGWAGIKPEQFQPVAENQIHIAISAKSAI